MILHVNSTVFLLQEIKTFYYYFIIIIYFLLSCLSFYCFPNIMNHFSRNLYVLILSSNQMNQFELHVFCIRGVHV